ncbi:MAG: hypothetical protein Q9191_004094, partial [Dirinaria sp. TL-2023a]
MATVSPNAQQPIGFMSIPLEMRLEIYKQSLIPDCPACKDPFHAMSAQANVHPEHTKYKFPVAILQLNHQVNYEAKATLYGPNPYTIAIDTYDLLYEPTSYGIVQIDRSRRLDMLQYVKRAEVHIEMMGETVWEWKYPSSSSPTSSRRAAVEYIHDSIHMLCRDFEQSVLLEEVVVSFGDKLHLQGFLPGLGNDPEIDEEDRQTALRIDRAELVNFDQAGYKFLLEGLK